MLRRAVWVGSAAVLGGGALWASRDEGLRRSLRFWGGVLPIYAHYRFVEWTRGDFAPLHDAYADPIQQLTLELRGFYVKLAQVVSTRDDMIPQQYLLWCKAMQDQLPPALDAAQVRHILEKELGSRVEELFDQFDWKPVGVASIGQVHQAKLKSGERVVVKVMFPGMERLFRGDIETIKNFCRYLQPQHMPFLNEIEKQFLTEFDYRNEARNLEEIRDNLSVHPWKLKVKVPRPYAELCSEHVLVMEWISGVKLIDGVKNQFRKMAEMQGKPLEELEREQKELLTSGKIRSTSIAASKRLIRWTNLYLQVSDFLSNVVLFLYNYLVAVPTMRPLQPYRKTEKLINLAEVVELLLQVHAHEIFVDGAFNGDPHPGNILLMPDGRLGLIDYGQVKHISPETRKIYARLIKALAEDNREEIIRVFCQEMQYRTKNMNPEILYKMACFWNDRDTPDITGGLNVQQFFESCERADPVQHISEDFVMAGRVAVLLRAVGNAFQLNLRVSEHWLPFAERVLAEH